MKIDSKFTDHKLCLRVQGGMDFVVMVRQTHHARRYILSLPKDQPNSKLVCPCCLNIHTDLEYITQTNDVC